MPVMAMLMVAVVMVPMIVMRVFVILMRMRVFGVQKLRLDLEDALQVEGIAVQHFIDRHIAFRRLVKFRIRVDGADAAFDLGQLFRRHEIDLIEQDDIGEGDLIFRFRRIFQPLRQPFGVGDRDDRVEACRLLHVGIDEEGLRDGGRIGEACRLDDDRVELSLALQQAFDDADEIAAHRAADAAIVHLENFFVGADDEIIVYADLAEFIDDDGELAAVRLGQNTVQQSGLARAQIAGEHGNGNFICHLMLRGRRMVRLPGLTCATAIHLFPASMSNTQLTPDRHEARIGTAAI